MSHRAMAAATANYDLEHSHGGCHRGIADDTGADRQSRPVVECIHGVAWKLFEQALLDHALCPTFSLLSRLKNEVHGSIEVRQPGTDSCCCQCNCHVAIVPTGVHYSAAGRYVRYP